MAATGVSTLLTQYAQALVVLKIAGGLYLLFLAVKAAMAALTSNERLERQMAVAQTVSGFSLCQHGLLMHLTNPKSVLAWIATMTLGLGPDATPATVAVILIGCAVLSVTIFCGYTVIFSTASMIQGYRRARRWIEGVLALVFGAAGMKLLFSPT